MLDEKGKKKVCGTKSMSAKDRVTAFVCTNADGSDEVPFSIIRKSANPRHFRLGQPAVRHFSQKNSWYDAVVFRCWFFDLFFSIFEKTSLLVALLMDNCRALDPDLTGIREQVKNFRFATKLQLPPSANGFGFHRIVEDSVQAHIAPRDDEGY